MRGFFKEMGVSHAGVPKNESLWFHTALTIWLRLLRGTRFDTDSITSFRVTYQCISVTMLCFLKKQMCFEQFWGYMQGLHEARNGGTVGCLVGRRSKMTFDAFGLEKNAVNDRRTWNQNRVTCIRKNLWICFCCKNLARVKSSQERSNYHSLHNKAACFGMFCWKFWTSLHRWDIQQLFRKWYWNKTQPMKPNSFLHPQSCTMVKF